MDTGFLIREARRDEYDRLGQILVDAYAALSGFPTPHEQPGYYQQLAQIGRFGERPDTKLLVAASDAQLLGGVVYFAAMAGYGSGGRAPHEGDAAAFRWLATSPAARGRGVGKALAGRCIELAQASGRQQVILHTTGAMTVAWRMYERMGFVRAPELDFMQERLPVFGFRLRVASGYAA
jgi:ribosomal protein S18 acetylase RimI-like enzyme